MPREVDISCEKVEVVRVREGKGARGGRENLMV